MADAIAPPTPELADLLSILGSNDTRELVRTFLKDTPLLLAELNEHIHSKETPSPAQIAAHSLKSTARLVGARSLSTQAAILELRFIAGGIPTLAELDALRAEFDRVSAMFAAYAGL